MPSPCLPLLQRLPQALQLLRHRLLRQYLHLRPVQVQLRDLLQHRGRVQRRRLAHFRRAERKAIDNERLAGINR